MITPPSPLPETSVRDLVKSYGGRGAPPVLRGVSHAFPPESFTAVMGVSGSGKTTLLNCLCGLETPDSGEVVLDGTPLRGLGEDERAVLRRDRCGFVFQDYGLFDALDVRGSVALPRRLAGRPLEAGEAEAALERVGLQGRARSRIGELSGGQRQGVAIARALVGRPRVIAADEPTGALDSRTARGVLGLLREAASEARATAVMVTHDAAAAAWADEVLVMADGRIAEILPGGDADRISRAANRVWG